MQSVVSLWTSSTSNVTTLIGLAAAGPSATWFRGQLNRLPRGGAASPYWPLEDDALSGPPLPRPNAADARSRVL